RSARGRVTVTSTRAAARPGESGWGLNSLCMSAFYGANRCWHMAQRLKRDSAKTRKDVFRQGVALSRRLFLLLRQVTLRRHRRAVRRLVYLHALEIRRLLDPALWRRQAPQVRVGVGLHGTHHRLVVDVDDLDAGQQQLGAMA